MPRNDIYKFESVIGAILHEEVEISLDKNLTILEKEFEDGYIFQIMNNNILEILIIYINYTPAYYIYYTFYNNGYEDFTTVSDVLTE